MGATAFGQKKLKKFSNTLNFTVAKGCAWGHNNVTKQYRLFDENNKVYYIVVDRNNKYNFIEQTKQQNIEKNYIFSKSLMALFKGEEFTSENDEINAIFKNLKDKSKNIQLISF